MLGSVAIPIERMGGGGGGAMYSPLLDPPCNDSFPHLFWNKQHLVASKSKRIV